jgi:hypothetical protein
MFAAIFFLVGLSFGYAARLPWALLAFLIPLGLTLAASDRDGSAVVLYFVITGIGILVGLVLATRTDKRAA